MLNSKLFDSLLDFSQATELPCIGNLLRLSWLPSSASCSSYVQPAGVEKTKECNTFLWGGESGLGKKQRKPFLSRFHSFFPLSFEEPDTQANLDSLTSLKPLFALVIDNLHQG